MSREQNLDLIYRHTDADFRGVATNPTAWAPEHLGKPFLLLNRQGGATLVPLDLVTDAEIAAHLPAAQKRASANRRG